MLSPPSTSISTSSTRIMMFLSSWTNPLKHYIFIIGVSLQMYGLSFCWWCSRMHWISTLRLFEELHASKQSDEMLHWNMARHQLLWPAFTFFVSDTFIYSLSIRQLQVHVYNSPHVAWPVAEERAASCKVT